MKTKNVFYFSILITLVSLKLNSQTLMKTYYDFQKTRVKEVYYVNSKGEKNGLFKFYSEYNGVLREEANFVNGQLNGTYKLYDVSSGRALLEKSETYKNGILNGPAIYYEYNELLTIPISQGNYLNGKKNGIWFFYKQVEFKTPENYKFYKITQTIKDGEFISENPECQYYPANTKYSIELKNENGSELTVFFPSGKIILHGYYTKDDKVISQKCYYENGQLSSEITTKKENSANLEETKYYYENGALSSEENVKIEKSISVNEKKEYYLDGKLKLHTINENGNNVFFEEYNEDGTKSGLMLDKERVIQERKDEENKKNAQKLKVIEDALSKYKKAKENADLMFENTIKTNDTTYFTFENKSYSSVKKAYESAIDDGYFVINRIKAVNKAYNLDTLNLEVDNLNNKVALCSKLEIINRNDEELWRCQTSAKIILTKGKQVYYDIHRKLEKEKDLEKALIIADELKVFYTKLALLINDNDKEISKKLKKSLSIEESKNIIMN